MHPIAGRCALQTRGSLHTAVASERGDAFVQSRLSRYQRSLRFSGNPMLRGGLSPGCIHGQSEPSRAWEMGGAEFRPTCGELGLESVAGAAGDTSSVGWERPAGKSCGDVGGSWSRGRDRICRGGRVQAHRARAMRSRAAKSSPRACCARESASRSPQPWPGRAAGDPVSHP